MTAHENPAPPPEADLIRLARQARALSPAKAAKLMPPGSVGVSRWRHIENGYSTPGQAVVAPDATLAHMAHVLGIAPDRLARTGREAAAEILREILRQELDRLAASKPPDLNDEHERAVMELPGVSDDVRRTMLEIVRDLRAKQTARRRNAG